MDWFARYQNANAWGVAKKRGRVFLSTIVERPYLIGMGDVEVDIMRVKVSPGVKRYARSGTWWIAAPARRTTLAVSVLKALHVS